MHCNRCGEYVLVARMFYVRGQRVNLEPAASDDGDIRVSLDRDTGELIGWPASTDVPNTRRHRRHADICPAERQLSIASVERE